MPFSIDDLIDKHDKHFNEWIDKLNKHSELWYSDNTFSQDENIKIVTDVVGVLAKICEIFYQYGNFKDVFENDNFYQHVCGPELIINTKKTKSNFRFGIDDNGIYLSTYLRHVENLKNMDDQFWADILKLTEYKKFELVGLDHVSRELKLKYPEQSYNYKSVVFKIFRRYFFNVTEYEGNMDDFGDLRICWSPDEGLDEIIRKGCEVFKLFYKLNYSLWKIEYLKQKKETIKRH